MLDISSDDVKEKLLSGEFGLEMEGLRTDENGYMAHTPHPFSDSDHIVRDFCENQTEINTEVETSPQAVVMALSKYYREIQDMLGKMPEPELLWAFSNPPYIKDESDIPVARFTGSESFKTAYRDYLSDRYGRYKMTFSGIHMNYSFTEELLRTAFEKSGQADYTEYKNRVYYPIRLKPKGANNLDALVSGGVNHIELRMIDVNPLAECGIDKRDVAFAQLLICWLATKRGEHLNARGQVQAIQNFKNAAHYDLKTVKIVMPGRETASAADTALSVIREMMTFYQDYPDEVKEILSFQEEKFLDAEKRYAWQIRKKFSNSYVEKGILLAKKKRELNASFSRRDI